jgi:acetate---CoA ligase (ADP-forming)
MNLDKFFKAKSIAIIGVSKNPNKVGHVIFRNLLDGHYAGRIYIINPNADRILNYKVNKTILEIKEQVDVAVCCVPAELSLKVIEQCGKKGIKHVVMVTAGFSEVGDTKTEEKLVRLLDKYKIKIIGPNCLGTLDVHTKLDTLFIPRYRMKRPKPGSISFACQSGAVASTILDLAATEGYGFAKVVSYGNALNVDESDLLEYLGEDEETKVICFYIEGIKNGRKFIDIAKKVTQKKPVIVVKGGITSEGSKAALSHTASLAGDVEIYKGMFKQTGIIHCESLEEMFNAARILEKSVGPKGNKVQIITNGGGYGIVTTDAVINNRLIMAEMDKKVVAELKKNFPPIVIVSNPMDLVGDATTERYNIAIKAALEDKNVDIIIVVALLQTPLITPDIIDIISEYDELRMKPIVCVSTGGDFVMTLRRSLEDNGVPCFTFPEEAVRAVKHLVEYYVK